MNRHGEADTMTERTVDPSDAAAFEAYCIERSRDPNELPNARQRALMACIGLPNEIQKWMISAGALEPLLDNLEATILAAEAHSHDALLAEVGRMREALEKSDRLFGHIMEELSLNDGDAAHAYARTGQQISRAALSGISTGRDDKKRHR